MDGRCSRSFSAHLSALMAWSSAASAAWISAWSVAFTLCFKFANQSVQDPTNVCKLSIIPGILSLARWLSNWRFAKTWLYLVEDTQ